MISSQARFAVALLSLAAAAKAPAAIGGGDLEPVEGVYSATGKPEPYEEALRDALIAEHAYRTCQMLVIPSFDREWVVYIDAPRGGGEPKLIYKEMRRHLWEQLLEAEKRDPSEEWKGADSERRLLAGIEMKVNRIEIPIPRSLANRLESSWFKMLARVRYPPAEGIIVTFDGIRYYAASWSQYGFRSGTTWSPAAGTRPAALVGIAEAMRAFALALPADRPALEDRIRSLNEDLLANLATSAPPP